MADENHAEVIRLLDGDLRMHPDDELVAYNLGVANFKIGDYEYAEHYFCMAIWMDPEWARPYMTRAETYHMLGEFEREISDYEEAMQLEPNWAMPAYNLGAVHAKLGHLDDAVFYYGLAHTLDTSDVRVYVNRAHVYVDKEEYNLALADCHAALEIDPGNSRALHLCAEICRKHMFCQPHGYGPVNQTTCE